jgi:hypothetical protein
VREPAKSSNSRVNTRTRESGKPTTRCKGTGFPRGGCGFPFLTHGLPVINPSRTRYPCTLVEWFVPKDAEVDEDTGMWVVMPKFECGISGRRALAIIHLDCIARAAHLLPVFGSSFVPEELHFSNSLDVYHSYFVNNYADHHCHEFLS